ncbi:MAG: acetyl-coenzyme A synthetase N-terminal domain-containing protein, partial [Pseudomonadota bacterium]
MSDAELRQVPAEIAASAWADAAKYDEMYRASIDDPDAFWGEQGKRLDWLTPYTKVKNTSYDYHNVSIKWFEDCELNVCANCVDRHVATRGDQTAIIWEGDDPALSEHVTYSQLYDRVRRFANILKEMEV